MLSTQFAKLNGHVYCQLSHLSWCMGGGVQYVHQIPRTEKMTCSIGFHKRLGQRKGEVCHGRLGRTDSSKFGTCLCLHNFYNVK